MKGLLSWATTQAMTQADSASLANRASTRQPSGGLGLGQRRGLIGLGGQAGDAQLGVIDDALAALDQLLAALEQANRILQGQSAVFQLSDHLLQLAVRILKAGSRC